jgi:hypothetical protein
MPYLYIGGGICKSSLEELDILQTVISPFFEVLPAPGVVLFMYSC